MSFFWAPGLWLDAAFCLLGHAAGFEDGVGGGQGLGMQLQRQLLRHGMEAQLMQAMLVTGIAEPRNAKERENKCWF